MVMLVVPKSTRMSGRLSPPPCATIADWTDDIVVLTFTPNETSLEMPVETRRPWLTIEDVPVSITAA